MGLFILILVSFFQYLLPYMQPGVCGCGRRPPSGRLFICVLFHILSPIFVTIYAAGGCGCGRRPPSGRLFICVLFHIISPKFVTIYAAGIVGYLYGLYSYGSNLRQKKCRRVWLGVCSQSLRGTYGLGGYGKGGGLIRARKNVAGFGSEYAVRV